MSFSESQLDINDVDIDLHKVFIKTQGELQRLNNDLESYGDTYPERIKKLMIDYADRSDDIKVCREYLMKEPPTFPGSDDQLIRRILVIWTYDNYQKASEYLELYVEQLYAEEILEILLVRNPSIVFESLIVILEQEYGESLLESATKLQTRAVTRNYPLFKDKDYARKILEQSAKHSSTSFLENFKLYQNEEFARVILDDIIVVNPGLVLRYHHILNDLPFTEKYEIVQRAIDKSIEVGSPHLIDFYANFSYGRGYTYDKLEEGLNKIVSNHPLYVLKNEWKLKKRPYSKLSYIDGIIEKSYRLSADKSPRDVINYYHLVGEDLAKSVLDKLFEEQPEQFLFYESWIDKDHELFDEMVNVLTSLREGVDSITMGNKEVTLDWQRNINIYAGLLKTCWQNREKYITDGRIDWGNVVYDYENNLQEYIDNGTKRNRGNTMVFFLSATRIGLDDLVNGLQLYDDMRNKYKGMCLEENFYDYSSDDEKQINSPDNILSEIEESIQDNPEKNLIIYLGMHGNEDGSANYAGGKRTKEHFDRLFAMGDKYPENIQVNITSCNSGYKYDGNGDNTIRNIAFDSSYDVAIGGDNGGDSFFLESFEFDQDGNLKGDFDGDGTVNIHEALLYRNLHYDKSLTPTYFDRNGEMIPISFNQEVSRYSVEDIG